ncbi:hypothetical protein B0T17DRAFT_520735 [Bombardia bombarda]|uniref:Uncharacterized protein n=1 Tax=Bombardia bombarda TaxID=252184 RepID=A0AA39XPR4_9PEZI|nr:hypothetical protein B0T17DRAFT_520735 [Bombardia bombarda]
MSILSKERYSKERDIERAKKRDTIEGRTKMNLRERVGREKSGVEKEIAKASEEQEGKEGNEKLNHGEIKPTL